MFAKLLIANRGEIARRVLRTCHRLGIETVAVYSDADAGAPHVREAGEAVRLGPAPPADSYLNIERVIDAAVRTGAEALHPGYGFLAENADFAEACAAKGIAFVGPRPETIRLMGDKAAAKRAMQEAGVPVLPGVHDEDLDDAALIAAAREVGFPLLAKPVAGGGGKGMRTVHRAADLPEALAAARREALSAFGDDRLLVERLVERARHVEIQVLGDRHGGVVHLFERECSVQRRHQKILEETPAPGLDAALRDRMCAAAVAAAEAVGYLGAGTVEFLLAPDGSFAFLETNTRLQVEHPVTEMVARVRGPLGPAPVDLVELQLRVAAGEPLPFAQDDLVQVGHALEARLYAEDAAAGFLPQTGRLLVFEVPRGEGVRVDAGVESGSEVTRFYDPLLAKLVVHGSDRSDALGRMARLLRHTAVLGVTTNLEFLAAVVADPGFQQGGVPTSFVDDRLAGWQRDASPHELLVAVAVAVLDEHLAAASPRVHGDPYAPWATLGPWRQGGVGGWRLRLREAGADGSTTEHLLTVTAAGADLRVGVGARTSHVRVTGQAGSTRFLEIDGHETPATTAVRDDRVWAHVAGTTRSLQILRETDHADPGLAAAGAALTAPMPGSVVAVAVEPGQHVPAGTMLVVVEAMKMEHPVRAPAAGTVTAVHVTVGDAVDAGQALVELTPDDAPAGVEEEAP